MDQYGKVIIAIVVIVAIIVVAVFFGDNIQGFFTGLFNSFAQKSLNGTGITPPTMSP